MTNAATHVSSDIESETDRESNGFAPSRTAAPTWSVSGQDADLADEVIADQSGRPLGRRALETRSRILEATVKLLAEKSMRDLRVIDIARMIGSSPATFYQYFKDVEDVVLYLASEINEVTPEMIEIIEGDWEGGEGIERGHRLANLVIEHWEPYIPILRVRNNAAEEGNAAFAEVRIKSMLPILTAFGGVIRRAHEKARLEAGEEGQSDDVAIHPISGAMMLTSLLEGLTTHHQRFEKRFIVQGEGRTQLVETLATIMQSVLTASR